MIFSSLGLIQCEVQQQWPLGNVCWATEGLPSELAAQASGRSIGDHESYGIESWFSWLYLGSLLNTLIFWLQHRCLWQHYYYTLRLWFYAHTLPFWEADWRRIILQRYCILLFFINVCPTKYCETDDSKLCNHKHWTITCVMHQ